MAAQDNTQGGKKSKIGLIILIAFVGLVVTFVALTALNVFGLRDNIVMPFLRNVPVIGNLINDPEGELDPLAAALLRVAELEEELRLRDAEIARHEAEMLAMEEEWEEIIAYAFGSVVELMILREMAEDFEEFIINREIFERELAEGNPEAFENFFATMHPVLAETIFRELMAGRVAGLQREQYLDIWSAMSPAAVANIIMARDMTTTNMAMLVSIFRDLPYATVARILEAIPDSNQAGAIAAAMYVP